MIGFAATKLDQFEKGKISRRALLESLTLAATTAAAGSARAATAPDPALKLALVNHISFAVAEFRPGADWYSRVFNLEQVGTTERDTNLPFGRQGDKPLGVTANDVPVTFLIFRQPNTAPPAPGAPPARPRLPSRAVISHVGYTVADFEPARALANLRALGVENAREDGPYSVRCTDPYGYDVQINGISSTALTAG
jgi:hypothetical protein